MVLLSGRWVEPIGGGTDRSLETGGLPSKQIVPSIPCFLLPAVWGEYFASLQAPGLHLPSSRFTGDSQLWVPRPVWTRIFERSNQKQLCFLYKFIMSSVLLIVQGCLMQMRGGKRNDGKGLTWPSSVGVGTEPEPVEQRYSESDRSRGSGSSFVFHWSHRWVGLWGPEGKFGSGA